MPQDMLREVLDRYGRAIAVTTVLLAWTGAALVAFLVAPTDGGILLPLAAIPLLLLWRPVRAFRKVFAICIAGCYGGLVLLELSIRLIYFGPAAVVHPADYDTSVPMERVDGSDSNYRMRPGFDGIVRGHAVHINRLGFRAPEPSAKRAGTLRMLTYGSSIAVGISMPASSAYPVATATQLSSLFGKPVEGIDLGVLAYGLPQVARLAVATAADYQPDLVVLEVRGGAGLLDGAEGRVFGGRQPPALRRHSFAATGLAIVANRLQAIMARVEARLHPAQAATAPIPSPPALETLAQTLPALRAKVGDRCTIVIFVMRAMTGFDQDRLIPAQERGLREQAARVGALLVDSHPWFSASELPDDFVVSPGDPHPNLRAHTRIAERLAQAIAPALRN